MSVILLPSKVMKEAKVTEIVSTVLTQARNGTKMEQTKPKLNKFIENTFNAQNLNKFSEK